MGFLKKMASEELEAKGPQAVEGAQDNLVQAYEKSGLSSLHFYQFLLIASFAIGFSFSFSLLSYDGKNPVNGLIFLAIFLPPQILTFTFALIGHRFKLASFFVELSKTIIKKVLRVSLTPDENELRRYFLWAGVLFGFGGILAIQIKLAFTDTIIGWSTTLTQGQVLTEYLIKGLALPWSWGLELATLSDEVINQSQFFRVNGKLQFISVKTFEDVSFVSHWGWFLSASIAFYGILPRLLMILVVKFRPYSKTESIAFDFTSQEDSFEFLFQFNDTEKLLLNSLQNQTILADISVEIVEEEKEKKKSWHEEWKNSVASASKYKLIDEKGLKESVEISGASKKIKAMILFSEVVLFSPYFKISKKIDVNSVDQNAMNLRLHRFYSRYGVDYKVLQDYQKKYFSYLDEMVVDKNWSNHLIKGFAIAGIIGVAAFFAAPAVGAAFGSSLFGLSGIVGQMAGLAALGGGAVLTGGFGVAGGTAVVVGCGALVGGVGGTAASKFYETYYKDHQIVTRDLAKLLALYDCKFFNQIYFEKNRSLIEEKIHSVLETIKTKEVKNHENLIMVAKKTLESSNEAA